ncbi:MAG TPA: MBL fold metallo-hydrolase [Bacillota bacterium]
MNELKNTDSVKVKGNARDIKVINIGGRVVNNYLLVTPSGLVVIDTGYAGGFDRFGRRLAQSGFSLNQIAFIVLTHAHDDHAGYLGELLLATEAPVILHPEAVERLKEGRNRLIGGCSTRLAQIFCKSMALAGKGKHLFPAVDVSDRAIIVNGPTQPLKAAGIPAEIMLLPGHTADSIGLKLEDGRFFCGDAAMNGFPSLARHTIWIEDVDSFGRSWDKMLDSGARTIFPSHGKPFSVADLRRYRHFMNGKKLLPL